MLKQRIITALAAGALLLVVLFVLPQTPARLSIGLILLVAAWEWSGLIGQKTTVGRVVYLALIAACMWAAHRYASEPKVFLLIMQIALGWWLAALAWTLVYPTAVPVALRWLCGVLVIVPAGLALDWLYLLNPRFLLLVLTIVWAADIGAYFTGKRFGRVKLAPQISPGKTWEGVFGGLIGVALLTVVHSTWSGIDLAVLIPLCLVVGMVSVVGDLTVSIFKRSAGVKDSGSLFPGHGGVLDRADSITAAAPLFALGLSWMGAGV
jgi:phosphatidate cytidylyltransferase